MYTWGYLKDVILSKLDLDENEATVQNLLSRFPFYANEVITQVCSAVKPKYTFAEFNITKDLVGIPQEMPSDFVSFGDDVCYELVICCNKAKELELHDDDFIYHGNNKLIFNRIGKFYISYNARWYTFDKNIDDNVEIDVPNDILDCIPSYVVSQCYKIDDEYKAQVFRNEYEIMLSRIDNTHYATNKTFIIGGNW